MPSFYSPVSIDYAGGARVRWEHRMPHSRMWEFVVFSVFVLHCHTKPRSLTETQSGALTIKGDYGCTQKSGNST
ncbi:hypothetical protein GCM10007394_20630 [Salinibacterium amurskyense]|nr:hypothetical protein GCM10007394_20630 [Salinibacterium amurskyense]